MNTRRCLMIADRMNALLLRELGQGIDGLRMVAEPLYARDVLLVCDALPGTEGPELAQHFRVAATERAQPGAAAPAAASGRDRSAASSGRDRTTAASGRDSTTAASSGRDSTTAAGDRSAADARTASRSGAAQGKDDSAGSRPSSGFGASVWSRLASGFGFSIPGGSSLPDSQPDAPRAGAGQRPARRWFSRSRG